MGQFLSKKFVFYRNKNIYVKAKQLLYVTEGFERKICVKETNKQKKKKTHDRGQLTV